MTNITSNLSTGVSLTGFNSYSGIGISIIVFITICLALFLFSKNIRKAIVGGFITGGLTLIGWFSKYVGFSTVEGDYTSIKWVGGIILFLIVSIGIGHLAEKIKWIRELIYEFEIKPEEETHK